MIIRNVDRSPGYSTLSITAAVTHPPSHILLADDDPSILRLSAELLKALGHDVDEVEDGAAAWHALKSTNYDLLITDNNMPGITGLELIKRLRGACKAIPAILVSGMMPTDEPGQQSCPGFQALLRKPYTAEDYSRTVSEVLNECKGQQILS